VGTVAVTPGAGQNGSSGLRITLKAPATGVRPDFHVAHLPNLALESGHRYRIQFWVRVDQRAICVCISPGQVPGIRSADWGCLFLADQTGCWQPRQFDQLWRACALACSGEAVDWTPVDGLCQAVLAANPKALLVPRISMNAPDWWLKAHPDEATRWTTNGPGSMPWPRHSTGAKPRSD